MVHRFPSSQLLNPAGHRPVTESAVVHELPLPQGIGVPRHEPSLLQASPLVPAFPSSQLIRVLVLLHERTPALNKHWSTVQALPSSHSALVMQGVPACEIHATQIRHTAKIQFIKLPPKCCAGMHVSTCNGRASSIPCPIAWPATLPFEISQHRPKRLHKSLKLPALRTSNTVQFDASP